MQSSHKAEKTLSKSKLCQLFKFFKFFSKKVLTNSYFPVYNSRAVDGKQTKQAPAAATDYGILAQLGEHLPYKQRVIGSSPIGPILLRKSKKKYGEIAQLARAYGSYP